MNRVLFFTLILFVILLVGCNKTPEYIFYGESENWKASYKVIDIKNNIAKYKYEILFKGTNANDLGEVELKIVKQNRGTLWLKLPLVDGKITGSGASTPFPGKDDILKVEIKWLDKIDSFDLTTEDFSKE